MASRSSLRLICCGALAFLAACGGKPNDAATAGAAASSPIPQVTSMETLELKPGAGPAIAAGQTAVVHYTGWLYEAAAADKKGKQFDSSRTSGQPFSFLVGAGRVIKGWDQGVAGMKVGEEKRLTIPAELAYGDSGAGGVIPPGATLVFDVELIAIN